MKLLVVFCLVATRLVATENVQQEVGQREARSSYRYDSQFDPPTHISHGKPLSEIPEHHRRHACTLDSRTYYEHGDLFRISYETRCITYRCEDSSYQIFQEGCLDVSTQRCVPVGHTWTIRCHTFLCTKKIYNGFIHYESARNNIGCYDDLAKTCRRQNELFPHVDKAGKYNSRCTCRIEPSSSHIVCF